jgi:hypothetical protein
VLADVVEAQRTRVVDQHAEQAAPARQVADGAVPRLVDPPREEACELATFVIEDADRGIASTREIGGRRQDAIEHDFEVELGQQTASHVDEPGETALVETVGGRHGGCSAYRATPGKPHQDGAQAPMAAGSQPPRMRQRRH